jgi:hypothetical protein
MSHAKPVSLSHGDTLQWKCRDYFALNLIGLERTDNGQNELVVFCTAVRNALEGNLNISYFKHLKPKLV